MFATIMYQNAIGNIISVIILDLEVIDGYRCFQDLMLNFLDNHILAIDENENVTGAELNSIGPALYRRVERMGWRGYDLFAADEYMY